VTHAQEVGEGTVAEFRCPHCSTAQLPRRFCVSCGRELGAVGARAVQLPALEHAAEVAAVAPPTGVAAPRRRLSRVGPSGGASTLHWVGVHGGAGETTLAAVVPGSVAAGHGWPLRTLSPVEALLPIPVILVARSHWTGLVAAQNALREWAAGEIAPLRMLGLAIVADSPVKQPKPLRDLERLVAGGSPATWRIPYVAELRIGQRISHDNLDPALERFRRTISSITNNL
jgi:hypothetical protein